MTDELPSVVVPHARFVEYQERRRTGTPPPTAQDVPLSTDVGVTPEEVPVLPHTPNGKL